MASTAGWWLPGSAEALAEALLDSTGSTPSPLGRDGRRPG
jgi:hypothetical protein